MEEENRNKSGIDIKLTDNNGCGCLIIVAILGLIITVVALCIVK